MQYVYEPPKLEARYEDEKWLQRKYGPNIARGMLLFLGAVISAENAYDLMRMPQFYMEHLKNNLKKYYSITLDKKKSKWRVILVMLDKNGNEAIPTSDEKAFLQATKTIKILEMSEHYVEY